MASEQPGRDPLDDTVEQRYRELYEGEGGRWFSSFRKGNYIFPLDENALDVMDIFHKVTTMARKQTLHSPIPGDRDIRVLDLGCGTGIWAIDVAEKLLQRQQEGEIHGDFKVIGVDLALLQPRAVPRYVEFAKLDIEDGSLGSHPDNSFNLIEARMLLGSIKDWPTLYQRIFKLLKPGSGLFEQVDIDWVPRCDDDTLPPPDQCVLQDWSEGFLNSMDLSGRSARVDSGAMHTQLEAAGFVDLTEQVIKLPLSGWPTDLQARDLGRWTNLAITQALDGLSIGPLHRLLGAPVEEIRELVSKVIFAANVRKQHGYFQLYIWNARRP